MLRSKVISQRLSQVRRLSLNTRPPNSIRLGQPTHETRPHIIPRPGDLTPGISAVEYYQRRLKLAAKMPKNSLAIILGNTTKYSSGSVFYDFQQDNNLYYLTGWLEPDSVMAIEKKSDQGNDDDVVFHMLVPPKDIRRELWEGSKSGKEGAYEVFNADSVEDISKASSYIKSLINKSKTVFYDNKYDEKLNAPIKSFFNFGGEKFYGLNDVILNSGKLINPLSKLIAELRSVKSPGEIEVMHATCKISSRSINKAMGQVSTKHPFATEKTLAKYLEYQFVKGGCDKQAYIPVVASGSNALSIHYTRNDDLLYHDELVFIDAGGKLGGYCADISRAWPNYKRGFTEPQKDLYEVVLSTNKKCIELCDESLNYSLHDIHEFSVTSLRKELNNLPGFNVNNSEVSRYLYPHYIGHHLGLDLHDVPTISRYTKLIEGNVITIEPGLYIPYDDKWPKHFQGIGIRIEDDVVVGKSNDEIINLTSGCVKEIADIESLIQGGISTPGVDDELVVLDI
ncbi:ICP55 [Candida pseudojiufengensis]|uniref:ICP55 n=1 Tax=Candida pseudojiufengensis TaxID=497109 RepID=UPI002224CF61|nr:ICP55 [Candida pseudojiufengensis]KAI5965211.1 ICP55 [Candida pseudojiufengensis]